MRNTVVGEQRGRAVSILGGVNRITRALAPLLGGWLSHNIGGSVPFYARPVIPHPPQKKKQPLRFWVNSRTLIGCTDPPYIPAQGTEHHTSDFSSQ